MKHYCLMWRDKKILRAINSKYAGRYKVTDTRFLQSCLVWVRILAMLSGPLTDNILTQGTRAIGHAVRSRYFVKVMSFEKCWAKVFVNFGWKVPELTTITAAEDGLVIGSAVTLTDMETFMKAVIKIEPKWRTRVLVEVGFWSDHRRNLILKHLLL